MWEPGFQLAITNSLFSLLLLGETAICIEFSVQQGNNVVNDVQAVGTCKRESVCIWTFCIALVPGGVTCKGGGKFGRRDQVGRSRSKTYWPLEVTPDLWSLHCSLLPVHQEGTISLQHTPATLRFCSKACNSLNPWTTINPPSYNLFISDIVSPGGKG